MSYSEILKNDPLPMQTGDGQAPVPTEHILQFFDKGVRYVGVPDVQPVADWINEVAHRIVEMLPRNPERTVALRKLLEAKDAAVRACLAK